MALGPYRENISFALCTRQQRDGTPELVAFFETPINHWFPMISLWRDKNDAETSPEDTLNVMGEKIAFCISDETRGDYDDLTPCDPKLIDPILMFAMGSLMRRVI